MTYMENTRQRLFEVIEGLSQQQLNQQEHKDTWSIMQTMHHLYLMEQSIAIIVANRLKSKQKTSADQKPIEKAVDRSYKVEAPSFLVPTKRHLTLAAIKEKLASSREYMLSVIANAPQEELLQRSYPHPAFGLLSLQQWIDFLPYHEERHIRQIEEIKQNLFTTLATEH
ncbi:hypothetical protein A374_07544 [Fictibacillus macauensis ZFHKF-1]|uniref:DinB-like domain-containing protein n=1 Tax=Fictibacillus macauensis ZFHKF-1 TaxID=1196324 RepID=I8AIU1_9BACL|nr:DinB family protein [Fictibacillus macauensis]EIT85672.1 hypothetical protein A374_07544 [Fictibacillus macauensis ZFHKF-1]